MVCGAVHSLPTKCLVNANAVHYSGSSTGTQLSLQEGLIIIIIIIIMMIPKSYFKTLQFLTLIICISVQINDFEKLLHSFQTNDPENVPLLLTYFLFLKQ